MRNLTAAAVTALLFVIFVLHPRQPGPWPRVAARIRTSGSPVEPVVFESQPSAIYDAGGEFPNGFLRVPFDFYFHGSNPRLAVSGADPAEAAKSITAEVLNSEGAWLVSTKGPQCATAELPRKDNVRIESVNQILMSWSYICYATIDSQRPIDNNESRQVCHASGRRFDAAWRLNF